MDGAGSVPSGEYLVEPELAPIAGLCSGRVKYVAEGGQRYVLMEGLRFLVRGAEKEMDALLCLNYPNGSYPTKLYLSASLGLGLNWNVNAYILARPWFSWSWKDVKPDQTPLEILAGHLEAFR